MSHSSKPSLDKISEYFNSSIVVDHYAKATANIGLWLSEEKVFTQVFKQDERILELGTGTGRIAFELSDMGYKHILASDVSRPMIKEARRLGKLLESKVSFQVADACELKFEDNLFDGAIFGFNGMMQIPHRENRRKAMSEIFRVVRSGGHFVFTTHFRENNKFKKFWAAEQQRWNSGKQNPKLFEFGDRYEDTDLGMLFIHVPSIQEIKEDLVTSGWLLDWEKPRSSIANEPLDVREFSDECRFWVARKP